MVGRKQEQRDFPFLRKQEVPKTFGLQDSNEGL